MRLSCRVVAAQKSFSGVTGGNRSCSVSPYYAETLEAQVDNMMSQDQVTTPSHN